MTIVRPVAIAALTLSSLATGTASAIQRESFTISVSHAGLDLTTEAGREAFGRLVRRAAHGACTSRVASITAWRETQRCTAELPTDATRQLAMRFGKDGERLASIDR